MSVFDRFRQKKVQEPNHSLVMVLLRGTSAPDMDAAFSYLRDNWPNLPSILEIENEGPVTSARISGGSINVVHVPAPVPEGDLEGPTALAAWHWPTARADVAQQRGHLIVHAMSTELDRVDLRLLLTKFAAAMVAVFDSIGVYVGDALLVRSAKDYLEAALEADRENLPLLLWVGFNP